MGVTAISTSIRYYSGTRHGFLHERAANDNNYVNNYHPRPMVWRRQTCRHTFDKLYIDYYYSTHQKPKVGEIKSRCFVNMIHKSTRRTDYNIYEALITSDPATQIHWKHQAITPTHEQKKLTRTKIHCCWYHKITASRLCKTVSARVYCFLNYCIQENGHTDTHKHHTTTVLRPFFRDHPGEAVPEENFWTL